MAQTRFCIHKYVADMLLSCRKETTIINGYQEAITRSLQLPHIPVTEYSADRSIFSLNLSRIQILTGTSVTNCNHKYGLMSTCQSDVDMFTRREAALFYPYRSVLMQTGIGLFCGKISENRLVCKNAVALAYYESCRLLVMGS